MANWLITGCSSGLGHELARAVLAAGHNAVITARDPSTLASLVDAYPTTALALELDVRDGDQITAVADRAEQQFDTIDVLVNNAGHGYRSAVEEGEDEQVRELFESNFHAPVNLIKAALPSMRERRSGTIVNIASIAADIHPAGSGYYAASKAALQAMSGALRKEVEPLGIRVITVAPGAFRTEFAGRSLIQSASAIGDYANTAGKRRKENDQHRGTEPGDPAKASQALIAAVAAPSPPTFLLLGTDAHTAVSGALEAQLKRITQWRALTLGTDIGS